MTDQTTCRTPAVNDFPEIARRMRELEAEDHKPDNSGLDDGPDLHPVRKKPAPKPAAVMADIRSRAWMTRRTKYGACGHG